PATVVSLTGGGGRHLLFAHPGRTIRNKVGLRPGLDVRGDGGYIVLPPSLHASGNRYVWERDPGRAPLPPLPPPLLTVPQPPKPAPRSTVNGSVARSKATGYAEAALRAECVAVAHAPEGTRNTTLNRAAFNLSQLVAGGVLDGERVKRGLLAAATDCGLPEHE